MPYNRYTPEALEAAVQKSVSIAGVLRTLGLKQAGGTHAHISRRIKALGIDTSHFLGQASNRGPNHKGSKKLSCEEVFVRRTHGVRQKSHVLRRALLGSGREYRCAGERCILRNEWLGRPLVLHVNHKNGEWLDDRAENLEFLCPNCHNQTEDYCRRKFASRWTKGTERHRAYRQRKRNGPVAEQVYASGLGPLVQTDVRVRIPPGPV
jgi:hypothetical protein